MVENRPKSVTANAKTKTCVSQSVSYKFWLVFFPAKITFYLPSVPWASFIADCQFSVLFIQLFDYNLVLHFNRNVAKKNFFGYLVVDTIYQKNNVWLLEIIEPFKMHQHRHKSNIGTNQMTCQISNFLLFIGLWTIRSKFDDDDKKEEKKNEKKDKQTNKVRKYNTIN